MEISMELVCIVLSLLHIVYDNEGKKGKYLMVKNEQVHE